MEKIIFLVTVSALFSWSMNKTTLNTDRKQAPGSTTQTPPKLSIDHLLICKRYDCPHVN